MKEINLIEIVDPDNGTVVSSHQFHPSKKIDEKDFEKFNFKFKEDNRGGMLMNVMEITGPPYSIMDIIKIVYKGGSTPD